MKKRNLLLKSIMFGIGTCIVGLRECVIKDEKEQLKRANDERAKYYRYYELLNNWILLKQKNIKISEFLADKKCFNVAIYGMNDVGIRLCEELDNSAINIKYLIDRNPIVTSKYEIKTPDNCFEGIDLMIVTPVHYFDEIAEMMAPKCNCLIVGLDDIFFEMIRTECG